MPLCPAEQKILSDSMKHKKELKGTSQKVLFGFVLIFSYYFFMNICILIREQKKGCGNGVDMGEIGGGDSLTGIYYIKIHIMNIDQYMYK